MVTSEEIAKAFENDLIELTRRYQFEHRCDHASLVAVLEARKFDLLMETWQSNNGGGVV